MTVSIRLCRIWLHVSLIGLVLYLVVFPAALSFDLWVLSGHTAWTTAATVWMAMLFGLAMHELGHVLFGGFVGLSLRAVHLRTAGAAVEMTPTERNAHAQLTVSFGGPLTQFVWAAAVFSIASSDVERWSAALVTVSAVANILAPWPANSDGRKVFRCLQAIVKGHGQDVRAW